MPRLDVRSKEQIKSVLYLFSLFIITASTVKALVNPVPLIDSVSPVSAAQTGVGASQKINPRGSDLFLAKRIVAEIDHHRVKTPLESVIEGI